MKNDHIALPKDTDEKLLAVFTQDIRLYKKFLIAYDRLTAHRETVIADCELMRSAIISDCSALDAELKALNAELGAVAELFRACAKENASSAQEQRAYPTEYNDLLARHEKATERIGELTAEKQRKQTQEQDIRLFIASLKKPPLTLKEWDQRLWTALLDRVTVCRDGGIVFRFKNGSEIEVEP